MREWQLTQAMGVEIEVNTFRSLSGISDENRTYLKSFDNLLEIF